MKTRLTPKSKEAAVSAAVRYKQVIKPKLVHFFGEEDRIVATGSSYIVNRILRMADIDHNANHFLAIIAAMTSPEGRKGEWIAPGVQETYAPWTCELSWSVFEGQGYSRHTIAKWLNVLEGNGLIVRLARPRTGKEQAVNLFQLTKRLFDLLNLDPGTVELPSGYDRYNLLKKELGVDMVSERSERSIEKDTESPREDMNSPEVERYTPEEDTKSPEVQNSTSSSGKIAPLKSGKIAPDSIDTSIGQYGNTANDNLSVRDYEVVHWIREVITSHQPHAVSNPAGLFAECGCSNQLGNHAKHGFVMSATPSSCDIKSHSALENANIAEQVYTEDQLAALEQLDMLD